MAVQDLQLQVRALDRGECEEILARNHVGRIAHAHEKHIDVKPVHYVYSDGWIYGRGPFAQAVEVVSENAYQWRPVAFEVEELDDLFHWRYAVVHGGFYIIDRKRSAAEAEVWQRALALLRSIEPDAFRAHDPAPDRTVLCRIAAQELNGEVATAAGSVTTGDEGFEG